MYDNNDEYINATIEYKNKVTEYDKKIREYYKCVNLYKQKSEALNKILVSYITTYKGNHDKIEEFKKQIVEDDKSISNHCDKLIESNMHMLLAFKRIKEISSKNAAKRINDMREIFNN